MHAAVMLQQACCKKNVALGFQAITGEKIATGNLYMIFSDFLVMNGLPTSSTVVHSRAVGPNSHMSCRMQTLLSN